MPDATAARDEACASARDLAMDALRGGPALKETIIMVMDETGALIETILVRDVLH